MSLTVAACGLNLLGDLIAMGKKSSNTSSTSLSSTSASGTSSEDFGSCLTHAQGSAAADMMSIFGQMLDEQQGTLDASNQTSTSSSSSSNQSTGLSNTAKALTGAFDPNNIYQGYATVDASQVGSTVASAYNRLAGTLQNQLVSRVSLSA